MAEPTKIMDVEGKTKLQAKASTVIKRGQLLGYSTGWVVADADTAAAIYAQFIALEDNPGEATGRWIKVCRSCTLEDEDSTWTANTPQYLGGTTTTAPNITETYPATDGDIVQVVGRSLDVYRCRIELKAPELFELVIREGPYDGTGEPGIGLADTGWVGAEPDGTEAVYYKGRLPAGLVGDVLSARVIMNSINSSAGDVDLSIVGAYDGTAAAAAANNQDTGPGTAAGEDWVQTDADNKILWIDVSAQFDSGLWKPGRNFCLLLDWDVLTNGATSIHLVLRGWKV